MLQLDNQSPFQASFAVLPDANGIDTAYAFVRGEFNLKGCLLPGDMQELPRLQDEYWGAPGTSSMKFPSDITLGKPGTDVLLVGSAKAPEARPVESMSVRLRVTSIDKEIAITGNRTWQKGAFGILKAGKPEPFASMPLRWENAYGGADRIKDDDTTRQTHEANPLGCGFIHPSQRHAAIAGRKLPNLEHPQNRMRSWKNHPVTSGFGAIAPRWQPRRDLAGTYDEAWQKNRAPYLPKDFNPGFFQTAPADQIVAGHLRGGEPVEIEGVTENGEVVRFQIPACHPAITFCLPDGDHIKNAVLETVIINTDESRLTLAWAANHPCDKKALQIREIVIQNTRTFQ
jgi:hypothetical protein